MTTTIKRSDIFRYRPYVLYFTAYSGSSVGNGMQFIANSWLALELTGASMSVAFVLIAAILPGVLFSPLIGIYVDRIDRKRLAVGADLFRAVVLLVVPLLWWLGLLEAWHLYLMTFLLSLGTEIYQPTAMGLIREVVPEEMLLYANSTNAIALQIGVAAGSGIGGLVIAFTSPIAVMLINAASFVFSAVCLWSMRKGRVLPTVQVGKVKGFRRFIDDMREGLSYIRENPSIIVKYIMLLVIWSTLRTINVLLAPFSKNTLNAGVQGFGYIDSGFAVGAIVGNMLLPAVIRKIGANATMTIGMLGMGVCLSIFAFTNSLWSAVAWYTALGVLFQVAILYITKAQESVPLTHQGRVHSTFNMLFSIASLFVYLIMGSLSEVVSSRWLYFGQGLIVIGAGLFAYRLIYRAGATATQDVSTNAHADHRRQEKDLAEGEGVRIADGALSEESPA